MDTFLLLGVVAVILAATWKWTTKKTTKVTIVPPAPLAKVVYPPVAEVQAQPVVEMAVTDGDVVEAPVKKVRKPRKKVVARTTAKKVVKKTKARKPKTAE